MNNWQFFKEDLVPWSWLLSYLSNTYSVYEFSAFQQ